MLADKLTPAVAIYETPQVIELGEVVALTNGNAEDDTADMGQYYF